MYKVDGLTKLSDYASVLGVANPEIDCKITSIKFDSRIWIRSYSNFPR